MGITQIIKPNLRPHNSLLSSLLSPKRDREKETTTCSATQTKQRPALRRPVQEAETRVRHPPVERFFWGYRSVFCVLVFVFLCVIFCVSLGDTSLLRPSIYAMPRSTPASRMLNVLLKCAQSISALQGSGNLEGSTLEGFMLTLTLDRCCYKVKRMSKFQPIDRPPPHDWPHGPSSNTPMALST